MTTISTGLTSDRLNTIMDEKIRDTKNRYENVGEVLGVTVGIIAGIATIIFGIYTATHLETEEFVRSDGRACNRVKNPLLLIGLIMGTVATPIPIGFAAGFGVYILVKLIGTYKANQIAKLKFSDKYKPTGEIQRDDIITLLKGSNDALKVKLLKEMNFQQLYAAKETLGEAKFKKLVKDFKGFDHQKWLSILSLQGAKPEEIDQFKNALDVQILSKKALYSYALHEHIQKITSKGAPKPSQKLFLSPLRGNPDQPPKSQKTIRIFIGKENEDAKPVLFIAERKYLEKNSRIFQKFFESNTRESECSIIKCEEDQNEATVRLFFSLLTQSITTVNLTMEETTDLLRLADKYEAIELQKALTQHLMTDLYFNPTIDENAKRKKLKELASPKNLQLQMAARPFFKLIETEKLGLKITPETFQSILEEAIDLGMTQLQNQCKVFARGMSDISPKQFSQLASIYEPQELEALGVALIANNLSNISSVYDVAMSSKNDSLASHCIQVCSNQKDEVIKLALWEIGKTPEAIAEALYNEGETD